MRTQLTLAALAFVAALALFVTRGVSSYQAGRLAAGRLADRVAELERVQREVALTGHAEITARQAERAELVEIIGQRRATLLGGQLPSALPTLETVLDQSQQAELAPDRPLRAELLRRVAADPRLLPGLVTVLEAVRLAHVAQLESLTITTDSPEPVPGVPGLLAHQLELVALCELPDAVELIEALVPGRGAPTVCLAGASVRRIEPSLWGGLPAGLTSPPVRLWLDVAALLPAETGMGSR